MTSEDLELELMPLELIGEVVTLPASSRLIKGILASGIEHCVTEAGISFLKLDESKIRGLLQEGVEEFDITQPDSSHVDDSTGVGYEIDEDTWTTLKGVKDGDFYGGSDLHIKWLSDAGLVVITDSGRIFLSEDAKTWISSTQ